MSNSELNVVTGGLSYIGKFITQRLVSQGKQVLILTNHLQRDNPFGNQVMVAPYDFDRHDTLVGRLKGASTLYNTYWVRFDHGIVSFEKAIANTERLIKAAEVAGIKKFVHISVSNPSQDASFPYYRGKAVLEKLIAQSRLSYAIIRPTLVYGGEQEILVNNIAWLLRRFPIFAVPSDKAYRLQPIHVDEVVGLAIHAADSLHNQTVDAAGPDIMTFEEMVRLIAQKIGSWSMLFHASPELSLVLLKIVDLLVNDIVLTRDEIGALGEERLVSKQPPIGKMRLAQWLDQNANQLGRRYASEMVRHFR
ncbi:MAG: NAD(P)H-binding protein [Nitrospirae bacterium]|nr:NAD(P)H-binding protein [Nitrospirota bacterium]